jgi:hypothetical protein
MKSTDPMLSPPAISTQTPLLPAARYTGPTAIRPSGLPSPLTVSTAVITLARNAAGGRVVSSPMNGAFTDGTKTPHTTTAAHAIGHETSSATIHKGSVAQTTPTLARRSGESRSSNFIATSEPTMAPTPKLVKIQPAMCGSRW